MKNDRSVATLAALSPLAGRRPLRPHQRSLVALAAAALVLVGAAPAEAYWAKSCSHDTYVSTSTTRVADINPGAADAVEIALQPSQPRSHFMAIYQGVLHFQADDGQSGPELWRTAGGAAGIAEDIVPGAQGSAPHAFAVYKNRLYFAATTPATGEELFNYDGTAVTLAADTMPGTAGGEIFGLTVYDGDLYFVRGQPNDGQQVWLYDGVSAQPVAAIDAAPGAIEPSGDRVFTELGGKLYFVRKLPQAGGFRLWVFDGTSASEMLALTPGVVSSRPGLGIHDGVLYFGRQVYDAPNALWEGQLWSYSGYGAPAPVATLPGSSGDLPRELQSFHGKLYFSRSFNALYRLDGSVAQELPTVAPDVPRSLTHFSAANALFLSGKSPLVSTDWEPYLFLGTNAWRLKNIMPDTNSPAGSLPTFGVEADGLYFLAEDDVFGRELWRTTVELEIPYFKCDVLVALPWEHWLEWPIGEREIYVETWMVGPRDTRLLSAERIAATPTTEARLRVLEIDTRREAVPEGFALVSIVSDSRTGERLDQGYAVVGAPEAEAMGAIEESMADLLATGRR